jgi:predicted peptidase
MNKIFATLLSLFSISIGLAQDFSLYEKKTYIENGDTLRYRILLPQDFNMKSKYPLIVFLHGSGERGNDNEKQLVHGGDLFIRSNIRYAYPAIVIFPQCPEGQSWANFRSAYDSAGNRQFDFMPGAEPTMPMQLVQGLITRTIKEFPVDKTRVYVGGLSMGGIGTFDLAARQPSLFAAAFPICGAGALQHHPG